MSSPQYEREMLSHALFCVDDGRGWLQCNRLLLADVLRHYGETYGGDGAAHGFVARLNVAARLGFLDVYPSTQKIQLTATGREIAALRSAYLQSAITYMHYHESLEKIITGAERATKQGEQVI